MARVHVLSGRFVNRPDRLLSFHLHRRKVVKAKAFTEKRR
ncbi:hypothetical protein THTE_0480 [Thermogutta terrifontis]|uniref:Uncharacterized protein n=1 Tax=Thermogutta terrifontis TaxID=1331910 RepID=A0A286RAU0_9BACT|nr:hypothetical protein THTE_0480 [Thermogutta terrifontis]